MDDLDQAVRNVIERCLAVQDGEAVLVVADPGNPALGEALMDAARAAGGDAVLTILPPEPERGTEPPPTVAAALAAADVFIAPCLPSLSHTTARKRASEGGARGATMPGVTADLLARLMSADFDAMSARWHARATLTGNTLEDEKILGTAHVAFGASAGIGGTVTVPVHQDVVVLEPSLWIGTTQVLDAGRWLLG